MPPKKKIKMGEEGDLLWIDDEVELLLVTARDFKVEKEHEAIDWESIKENYESIKERFIRNFPYGQKSEEYPHSVTVFTQERIASKIKHLR